MPKNRRFGIQFLASLTLLLTCAAPRPMSADDVMVIAPSTKKSLDEYLKRAKPAAFAVSEDGNRSYYIYCDSVRCNPSDRMIQRDALQYCGKDCVILAVGKDIKLPYRVGEESVGQTDLPFCKPGTFSADFPAGTPELQLPVDICTNFRSYVSKRHYRVYVTTDLAAGATTWGQAWGYDNLEEAISGALGRCRASRERDGIESECRLFALGDIIVYDMSDAELRAATELYKTNKNATNADLPAN